MKWTHLYLTVAALTLVAAPTRAEDPPAEAPVTYKMDSEVEAGYRTINIDGSKAKYREDYDLRSGGRLFNLTIRGSSDSPKATAVDRFRLQIDTPGDEPVSHFRLSASGQDRFDLRARFIRSRYEYAVPQLFEGPVAGNVRTDDLHDFDFIRTNGSVDLNIRGKRGWPSFQIGYRLYQREGDSTSTVRVADGDTFLVRAPIASYANVGYVGTQFRAFDTSVSVRQEYRRVDRTVRFEDPIDAAGLDPTDVSTLTDYRSRREDHIDVPTTTVRMQRSVGEDAEVTAAYFFSKSLLDFNYSKDRTGTSRSGTFDGFVSARGDGEATLDTHVLDLGTSVRVAERVRLHGTYRLNYRTQDGEFDETGTLGSLSARPDDEVRMHSLTGEVEIEPLANLLIRAGVRYARRDADLAASADDITTDTIGAIGSVRYRPSSLVDFFLRYENVRVGDPFVVAGRDTTAPQIPEREIVLTFTNRASAGVGLHPWEWLDVDYRFTADSRENDSFDGLSRIFGNSVTLTLRPLDGLSVYATYTRRDFDHHADILTAPLYETVSSVQDGAENVFVGVVSYDFGLYGQRWSTGANVSYVDSDTDLAPRLETGAGTTTAFDLDRTDGGVFLTLYHRWLEPTVEFRIIDYNEPNLPENDYSATMVLVKAKKRFNF